MYIWPECLGGHMTWKYWVSGPMLVPLVSTCHEIEFTDYSSALAFLSGSKCAVTHSYSAPSLSCHYFHRQVTKIILPGPDTPGGSASTALIIIPAPPSESLSECPARVESWPHQIPGAGRSVYVGAASPGYSQGPRWPVSWHSDSDVSWDNI